MRGQAAVIGVVIAVVLMLAVVLPTTTNTVGAVTSQGVNATQGASSSFNTIVRLLPLLIGVGAIVMVAAYLYKER